jgi:hypothetical protein
MYLVVVIGLATPMLRFITPAMNSRFVYGGIRLIDGSRDWYEFVQWTIVESMLALSFGNWLIWRRRVNSGSANRTLAGLQLRVYCAHSSSKATRDNRQHGW